MEKIKVAAGITWVSVPEADFHLLCGCPMDSVKHLMRLGLIRKIIKGDVVYESGPNAILLSDTQMQNGDFANVSEFPVLHMMYRQGMVIPNHPGNSGNKPILIGNEEQISAQSQYIFRGAYGLVDKEELMDGGVSSDEAEQMLVLKRRFNFNNIRKTEDLLDLVVIKDKLHVLKNGVTISRKGFNIYEIGYKGESEIVDLNLGKSERYEPPYTLDFHKIKREYFSVIHIGDGNGWDRNRPCMGSILTFQGKFYLIDAGPSLQFSLKSLGISVNDIEGIFQTHGHDDHFCGLTSLVHTDHKIKYYATPLVRKSVLKKMTALMNVDEEMFNASFDIYDLNEGEWNYLDGLEVKPIFSPHPVETNILYFRTFWHNGYKSYGHLADIASDRILNDFLEGEKREGITRKFYSNVWKNYLMPADLKKIDIGGGMIHGDAEDFRTDQSKKIILSHKEEELNDSEKEIGSSASFGMQDILIPSVANYYTIYTRHYLKSLLPGVSRSDLNILQNGKISQANVGTILIKKGEYVKSLFLIISGLVELVSQEDNRNNILSSGSLLGPINAIDNIPAKHTYRTASYVEYLEIPTEIFLFILERNKQKQRIRQLSFNRSFLRNSRILGVTCSCSTINKIAEQMELVHLRKGESLSQFKKKGVLLLKEGKIGLYKNKKYIEAVNPGNVFALNNYFKNSKHIFSEVVESDSSIFVIPNELLNGIPVILWKFLKVHDLRMRLAEELST